MRRDAALLAEASALLARFAPGPGRTGRVVLHPRLTILPLRRDDFAGLASSFMTDVPVHVVGEPEIAAGAGVAERAAACDEAIRSLDDACSRHLAAAAAVAATERDLLAARSQLDHVYEQRARAQEAIAAAQERLATLEGAAAGATDLYHELEIARAAAAEAAEAFEATAAPRHEDSPDLSAAEVKLAAAQRELDALEARQDTGGEHALDAASYQIRYWAAQRAVEVERHEVDRLRTRLTAEHATRARAEAAERAFVEASARVEAIEHALAQRRVASPQGDATAEIAALREQIDSVQRSIAAAETTREGEVRDAQLAVDTARREAAVAERQRAVAVDRAEPGADAREADYILAHLRACREELDSTDASTVEGRLRLAAQASSAPIMVVIEPFVPAPPDLVAALVAVSAVKRLVYVTDDEETLRVAAALDPEFGAVRTPLDTPGFSDTDRTLL